MLRRKEEEEEKMQAAAACVLHTTTCKLWARPHAMRNLSMAITHTRARQLLYLTNTADSLLCNMATRGLYSPDGGGRDLYMCPHIAIPFKGIGKGKAPQHRSHTLGTRTDPLPRYKPDGSGRDLFNISQPHNDRKEKRVEAGGIFSRKIPDALHR